MDAQTVEQSLLDAELPDCLPSDQGWIMPQYGGLSIANLPATVAALLGCDLPGSLPALPDSLWADWIPGLRRVVLVVLDALGYQALSRMWAAGEGLPFSRLAEAGRFLPLTSVFPSTTDAALMSLSTGRPPSEHGWLAFEMYLREIGVAANAILLSPIWSRDSDLLVQWGLEPEKLISVPSLAECLFAEGIETQAVLAALFKNTGFTTMLYRGMAGIQGHVHASDLWVHLRHLLARTRGKRALITAYWSGLDTLGHYYGQDTDLWEAEFRNVSYLLERELLRELPRADRDGTLLLVTADHGQTRIPDEQILTANEDAALTEHLMVPVMGESRAAFVHPRPGRETVVRDHLEGDYPGWFTVLDSARALDAGLMGCPVCDEAYARAGGLLVLPKGNHALQRSRPPFPLIGRHGGLTPAEMLVPLVGARLENLS